ERASGYRPPRMVGHERSARLYPRPTPRPGPQRGLIRQPPRASLLLPYLALGLLALIWGGSFLFIKVADEDMSAAMLVLSRSVSGLLTLGLVFAATRQSPVPAGTGRRLPTYLVMGVFGSLLAWAGFG